MATVVIASQNFNAISSGNTFNADDNIPDGTPLTNAGSSHISTGPGDLGFETLFFNTRGGQGPAASDTSDFIGVNSFAGSNAPDVSADGTPVQSGVEHNFEFNDGDGNLALTFDAVDLTGFSSRTVSLDYFITNTGYESDDNFSITVSDGVTTVTVLNFGELDLEASSSLDDGSANWNSLTIDLDTLIADNGLDASNIILTVNVDTNSGSENIFVDNISFEGNDGPAENIIFGQAVTDGNDDFISFSQTDTSDFFPGDAFTILQRGTGEDDSEIPFTLADDSAGSFSGDTLGIVGSNDFAPFFGITDTVNGAANGGAPVVAEWVFDIAGALNPYVAVDLAAIGDFEASDTFFFEVSIDGGDFLPVFTLVADEDGSLTYTLESGTETTLNDPLTVAQSGTVLDNNFSSFFAQIAGSGATLTFRITAETNGGTEGVAFRNVVVSSEAPEEGTDIGLVEPEPEPTFTDAAIYEIQGASHISPLLGEDVRTTGIVTAVDTNGFYLQDAVGDGDAATSDAIFVFTGSAPSVAVGDEAQVIGAVEEFGFSGRLTVTQIDAESVEILSSGNALPAAVIIGANGLTPPTEIIISDDETLTAIDLTDAADAAANIFDPEEDGIDFYEALEGMLVTVEDAVAVAPSNGFGEIFTVADGGAGATGLTNLGTINVSEDDFNPERVQIQIDSTLSPDIDISGIQTGDSLGDVTGVVSYNFGNFEVIATEIGEPVAGGLTPEVATLQGDQNEVSIATYNVLNLDPGDTDQIQAIAQQIVDNLLSPDILALQEIQDNNGAAAGVVASDQTLQAIIDAVEALGGPTYSFAVIDPVAENTQGGQPNGNIRVAYLYNEERVDLIEGSVIAVNEALLTDAGIAAADAFNGSRIPLQISFEFNSREITLINNHFTSRGGSDDLFGANQPAEPGGEDRRFGQATALNAYVNFLLANNSAANIVVLGDFNDFEFSPNVSIIEGSGNEQILFDQVSEIPLEEGRSTFIFQGNAQAIDNILVTGNLDAVTQVDIISINTPFQNSPSDHDPILSVIELGEEAALAPVNFNGSNGDDTGNGSLFDDRLWGKNGNDSLTGFDGDDRIGGGNGDDTLDGGDGDDQLFGSNGNDNVDGGDGDDRLFGGNNDDVLDGDDGNDVLFGGNGDDTLNGGDGDDILHGGGGADTFVFDGNSGDDTIKGFDDRRDILDISDTVTDFTSVADVIAAASDVNGGVLIDLGGDSSLFIQGSSVSDLDSLTYLF